MMRIPGIESKPEKIKIHKITNYVNRNDPSRF